MRSRRSALKLCLEHLPLSPNPVFNRPLLIAARKKKADSFQVEERCADLRVGQSSLLSKDVIITALGWRHSCTVSKLQDVSSMKSDGAPGVLRKISRVAQILYLHA